jgi:hypothetical protein
VSLLSVAQSCPRHMTETRRAPTMLTPTLFESAEALCDADYLVMGASIDAIHERRIGEHVGIVKRVDPVTGPPPHGG